MCPWGLDRSYRGRSEAGTCNPASAAEIAATAATQAAAATDKIAHAATLAAHAAALTQAARPRMRQRQRLLAPAGPGRNIKTWAMPTKMISESQ